MSSGVGLVLAALAVVLVGVGVAVLPDLASGDYVGPTTAATEPPALPRPGGSFQFVSGLRAADSVLVDDGAVVTRGDTLGIQIEDAGRSLREDLYALSAGELSVTEALTALEQTKRTLPAEAGVPTFLAEIQGQVLRTRDRSGGATGIGTAERELLSAEVMGAEDALRDLREQLRFIGSAGSPDARQQAAALRRSVTEKETFLRHARRTLSVRAAPVSGHENRLVRLNRAHRERIRNYAATLAPDSTFVLAPETGTFRRYDGERPNRIELPPSRAPAPDLNGGGVAVPTGGYELRSKGLPRLWSTAERRDSVRDPGNGSLIVVPE